MSDARRRERTGSGLRRGVLVEAAEAAGEEDDKFVTVQRAERRQNDAVVVIDRPDQPPAASPVGKRSQSTRLFQVMGARARMPGGWTAAGYPRHTNISGLRWRGIFST